MADSFKVGDVVQLKSGGPKMTVIEPDATRRPGQVACTWFTDKTHPESGLFPKEAIKAFYD